MNNFVNMAVEADKDHEAGVAFLAEFNKRWPGVREAIGDTLAIQLNNNSGIDLTDEQQELTLFVEKLVARAVARHGTSVKNSDVAQAVALMVSATAVQTVLMHTLSTMIEQADEHMRGENEKAKRTTALAFASPFIVDHRDSVTRFIRIHYNHLMVNIIDKVLPQRKVS